MYWGGAGCRCAQGDTFSIGCLVQHRSQRMLCGIIRSCSETLPGSSTCRTRDWAAASAALCWRTRRSPGGAVTVRGAVLSMTSPRSRWGRRLSATIRLLSATSSSATRRGCGWRSPTTPIITTTRSNTEPFWRRFFDQLGPERRAQIDFIYGPSVLKRTIQIAVSAAFTAAFIGLIIFQLFSSDLWRDNNWLLIPLATCSWVRYAPACCTSASRTARRRSSLGDPGNAAANAESEA